MIAKICYTDNTYDYNYLSFDENYSGWQYASGIVAPKSVEKVISTIEIILAYDYNVNRAYFDNISLVEEPAQTYRYNDDGELKSVNSTGNSERQYEYEGADLIEAVLGGYGTYTYEYDDAHNMVKATNDGVSLETTYDEAGNANATVLKQENASSGLTLRTSATYSSDGNYLLSSQNANGQNVYYRYDSLGRNTRVTGADGTITQKTYETGSHRVKNSYISGVVSIFYTYAKGLITDTARHSARGADTWQRYHTTYDNWGNPTEIRVQSGSNVVSGVATDWTDGITLGSYSYSGNNGLLERETYANGDYVTFDYDNFGRAVAVSHFNSNDELTYTEVSHYGANGYVDVCYVLNGDNQIKTEYRYIYDSLGRLIQSTELDSQVEVITTEHQYDLENRLTQQSIRIENSTFSEHYSYDDDDGSLKSLGVFSGDTLNYRYDGLKRLASVTAETESGSTRYTRTNTYRLSAPQQTTTQITRIRYSGFSGAPSFNYTYSADGNIASEWVNDELVNTYEYDEQGQLIVADGAYEGTSTRIEYSYDSAGNLRSVDKWSEFNINGNYVNSYDYCNEHWEDLLTAFNEQPIAYEGQHYDSTTNTVSGDVISGNPISYYNGIRWSFDWQNGRQLASAQSAGTVIRYTYDGGGLRTSKTVNGTLHSYIYAGGLLLRESIGDDTLDFAYDAQGRPYSLTYNGATYYYITNLQGDVINLINSNGATVATYEYDPFGRVLSANGFMAEHNPLRYRGYYYDTETGFYYLKSRYYDPVVCRFLNSDSLASTGQGFLGYNMFAYCENNPVNSQDGNGTMMCAAYDPEIGWLPDTTINPEKKTCLKLLVDLAYSVAAAVYEDFKNFSYENDDESVVLSSHFFSAYKGEVVVHLPIGANAFSFGFMVIGNNVATRPDAVDVIKHEYGHTVQFNDYGIVKYTIFVAVPSIAGNLIDRAGLLPIDYYAQPWEHQANIYGSAFAGRVSEARKYSEWYNFYAQIYPIF